MAVHLVNASDNSFWHGGD